MTLRLSRAILILSLRLLQSEYFKEEATYDAAWHDMTQRDWGDMLAYVPVTLKGTFYLYFALCFTKVFFKNLNRIRLNSVILLTCRQKELCKIASTRKLIIWRVLKSKLGLTLPNCDEY